MIMSYLEKKMIYYPEAPIESTPDQWDMEYEDVRFTADDGVGLHGWLIPAPGADFTLLFFHGNAGNMSHRLDNVQRFHRLGLRVFIVSYRGYGQSEGEPSEEGLYKDARAAYRVLKARPDTGGEPIAIFGRSLGGAVAIDLATRVEVMALIVESTFTSTPDMAKELFPFLPIGPFMSTRFDSISKISRIDTPLLHFHGTRDDLVPYAHGQRLFQAAKEPKEFYPIEGAMHNDTYFVGGEPYFVKIRSFLASQRKSFTDLHG